MLSGDFAHAAHAAKREITKRKRIVPPLNLKTKGHSDSHEVSKSAIELIPFFSAKIRTITVFVPG